MALMWLRLVSFTCQLLLPPRGTNAPFCNTLLGSWEVTANLLTVGESLCLEVLSIMLSFWLICKEILDVG